MIYFSDNELIALVEQDVPYLDNTTFGLGISIFLILRVLQKPNL